MLLPDDNESLKIIIEESPMPIALYVGREMIIRIANPAIIKAWGRDASVVGRPLVEALPELKDQPFPGLLQQVYDTGESYTAKEDHVRLMADGRLQSFYYDFTYKPLKNAQGEVWGILNNATNVTELVMARKRIAVADSRFRKMVADAPVAIGVLQGEDLVVESANREMLALWGKTTAIIGQPFFEVLPGLNGHMFRDMLQEVLRSGERAYGNEIKVRLERNGITDDCYFNFTYAPVRNDEHQLTGVMIIAGEITEQVKAKLGLQESEQRFRSLIEDAPMATAMFEGRDMVVKIANEAMFSMWGKNASVLGKPLREAVPELIGQPFLQILDNVYTSGIAYHADQQMAYLEVNGQLQPFWFNFTYQPLYNEQGEVYAVLDMAVDVSKQVQLQKQKDDFLGIASHELKTPVTSLKAYIQVLEMLMANEGGDTTRLEMVRSMNNQVNKLTSLIEDLLDVTKIQAGRLQFNEAHFEFSALVNEALEDIRYTTGKHAILLDNTAKGLVFADKERITQVIANLVSNAVKYSPHSDRIIISAANNDAEIHFYVRDFGIGIPEDKKDKVFEQFYRVSDRKQHTFPGLGLGLYISSEIVRNQGGRMWVDSAEGKGSTFYFSLPLSGSGACSAPDSTFP